MTVLRFDGVDDRVIFPIGAFNGMAGGPITYGVLYRTDDLAVTRTIVEIGVSAGGRIGLGVSSGDFFRFYNGGSTRDGPTTPAGWFLGVTTKATGSVVPRYHIYDFTAGTWAHGAQGAATANQTLGNGEVRFGESLAAAQDWTGDVGLGFLANVELSDAAVEAMTANRKTSDIWAAIGGATTFDLWELISGSAITSLGGSVETSRTGTTTTAESIPGGWTFDGVGGAAAFALDAQPGSYALSGTVASPVAGRVLSADPGSHAVTGAAASPVAGRVVAADPGAYAVTGSAATPLADRLVHAEPGNYALSAPDAILAVGYFLAVDPGSYALTGTAASLAVGRVVSADPASYALTGSDAELLANRLLNAVPGSYTLTGVAAELVYGTVGAYSLNAEAGSYTLTGLDATALATRLVTASPGSYALTGSQAGAVADRTLNADAGAVVVSGAAAGVLAARLIVGAPGTFALTGFEATLGDLPPETDFYDSPTPAAGGYDKASPGGHYDAPTPTVTLA